MEFALSSNTFLPLSSFLLLNDFVYFNKDRGISDTYALSSLDGVEIRQYDLLRNIADISINNDSLCFLTTAMNLSTIFSNIRSVSSIEIGVSGLNYYNKYYWNLADVDKNRTVDVEETSNLQTNYLVTVPYKKSTDYNVIPLKSSQGVDYEYDYVDVKADIPTRRYDAIYFGNNQEKGYPNLFAQYRCESFPVNILSDQYNVINLPDKISNFDLSAINLRYAGAVWGDSPCNSDIIMYDRFGYENVSNSGKSLRQLNGLPLCVWLSGNGTVSTADAVWMERWYDPNVVTQGQAFIAQVNTTSALSPIVDIPSSLKFCSRSKFTYLRFGENRNTTFINSFSGNLEIWFKDWSNIIEDEVHGVKGFAIPTISDDVKSQADLDGSLHFHIPPTDDILINNNITVGLWANQASWDCGIDTQYFGNFSNNEGYGLFFNTGSDSKLLTFPTTSGFIYGFNNRGFRVFEKSINESMSISSSRIDYLTTDLYGARWLYDGINKKIYKLDTDDLLENIIHLPNDSVISKMQINSQNNLVVLDTVSKNISGFDSDGNLNYGPSTASNYNNFEIGFDDSVLLDFANLMLLDNSGRKIKAIGTNLYRETDLFYHVGYKIQAMNIDTDNNLWIVYNSNRVLKLDEDGFKLLDFEIQLPFSGESSIEIGFVKEIKNGCDRNVLWVVFNSHNYIVKIDSDGNILKRLNIKDVVNLKNCRDFYLNVIGDFTGFTAKRKFNKIDSDFVSSTNPAISLRINVNCGDDRRTIRLNTSSTGLYGWNYIAFSHTIVDNQTFLKLYVNGQLRKSYTINGTYFIDYGTKVSPFIVGGRSGKLGATNVEIGLNNQNYFQGSISDIRIYSKPLNLFELRGLSSNLYYNGWEDMTWYIPTVRRTYMEEIVGYHLNQYHGSKSNKFNIRIKNMRISDDDTKEVIKSAIQASVKKFTPIHTELNEIIFE